MKAPIMQAAAEAASAPGCFFPNFWGLEFRLGPDLAILSRVNGKNN
jgi:hypothetical protein